MSCVYWFPVYPVLGCGLESEFCWTLSMLCGLSSFTFFNSKIGTVHAVSTRGCWDDYGRRLERTWYHAGHHGFFATSPLSSLSSAHHLYSWTESPWIVFLASFPGDLLLSSAHRRSRQREGQGSPSLSYPLSSSSSGICHVRQLLWWPSSVPPAPGIGTSPLTSG